MKILFVSLTFLFTILSGFSTADVTSPTDISATEITQITIEAFLNDGTSEIFYFTAEDDIRCELENIFAREDVHLCSKCVYYPNGESCCVTGSCDTIDEVFATHCGSNSGEN